MPASSCGFSTDCTRHYSLVAVNVSAAAWDPQNPTLVQQFEEARTRARAKCIGAVLGKGKDIRDSTGWCLRKNNGVNISACRSWRVPHLSSRGFNVSACRTYFLPKGPPQYYPADRSFVTTLAALLAGRLHSRPLRGVGGGHHRSSASYDSLADFGAGVGAYGHALLSIDPKISYSGYDGAGNVEHVTNGFVRWFDLSLNLSLPRADWVMSLEVGEHLPSAREMMYVRNLVAHARKGLVLSWANLRQPGYGHINNHSPRYLSSLFAELGFRHDANLTAALRAAAGAKGNAQYWLAGTVSAYVRWRELLPEA